MFNYSLSKFVHFALSTAVPKKDGYGVNGKRFKEVFRNLFFYIVLFYEILTGNSLSSVHAMRRAFLLQ